MTADASASSLVPAQATTATTATTAQELPATPEPTEASGSGQLLGDPMMLGLPCFIVGAAIPIILTATAIGLFLATIWAASLGQNAVASVFGIFAGFWLSYAVLVLGLTHNWFGILPASAQATQELFLVAWLVVIVMLTLTTLRLPVAYTAVFFLVAVALLLVFLGVNEGSTGLLKAAGYVALVFAAIGVYLYASSAAVATGGRPLQLGRPVLH